MPMILIEDARREFVRKFLEIEFRDYRFEERASDHEAIAAAMTEFERLVEWFSDAVAEQAQDNGAEGATEISGSPNCVIYACENRASELRG